MLIEKHKSLKELNTFGVDAIADSFIEINNENDVSELFNSRLLLDEFIFLGAGSNILFTSDFHGTVIKSNFNRIEITDSDDDTVIINCGSGVNWHTLVEFCLENNYYGLENLALIPGSVGAAPVQNIGAYGIEQKDYFFSLDAFNLETGQKETFEYNDCKFGYRQSIFKLDRMKKYFITKVNYKMNKNFIPQINYKDIRNLLSDKSELSANDVFNAVCSVRTNKLPDVKKMGNGGSFFKNPVISSKKYSQLQSVYVDIIGYKQDENLVKLSAAWLIEKAGWKGHRNGDAGVYGQHSLILVNYGNATGDEILKLSEQIKISVKEMFDVELQNEVIIK